MAFERCLGNDTYMVDNSADVVVESSTLSTEIDTVKASVSYSLGANQENLWLTGFDAINATGNSLNNTLSGNIDENILDGQAGIDTVTYGNAESRVSVSLSLSGFQYTIGGGFDKLVGIENLKGSIFSDNLTGNAQANRIDGGAGDDTLIGGEGNDVLVGDLGTDEMQGGGGNDIYYFSAGDLIIETSTLLSEVDTVISASSYRLGTNLENLKLTGSANVNATGNALDNTIYASAGNNVLDGSVGTDTLSYYYGVSGTSGVTVSLASTTAQTTGGSGSDTISGFENLYGSNNNDRLTGSSGNNILNGGSGNDNLSGGDGADTLIGGAGKDTLVGGNGNDIFDFNALTEMGTASTTWDVISSFIRGQDKIDLSTLDANTATATNDAFNGTLFTGASFTAAGQLKLVSGVLYGNTDGDGTAEFAIALTGITTLSSTDFVL